MSKITKTLIMVLVSVLLGAGIMLVPGLSHAVRWGLVLGLVVGGPLIKKALSGEVGS